MQLTPQGRQCHKVSLKKGKDHLTIKKKWSLETLVFPSPSKHLCLIQFFYKRISLSFCFNTSHVHFKNVYFQVLAALMGPLLGTLFVRDSVNLQTLTITVIFTHKGKILFYDKVCRSANNIMKNNSHMSCITCALWTLMFALIF